MSSVTLKNISKRYPNGVLAVSDFNLEIEDKEFIILVGPSGCGKSTTLRMIAGLEEITAGELYIDGSLVNSTKPKDRDISMVFQNYALYPHMSVYDNISFGLRIRRTPRGEIKERVEQAAKILEIEHLLERKPAQLSGGQRQRVALGRAIVRNPKVFLLDEPLSNLDAKLRTAMRAELSKLHQRLGTTFIYVTHDQTEAMTMGTRIVVMKDGFVQQIAPPQELFNNPCNLFVATFIGTPQMNVEEATLRIVDGTAYLEFGAEGYETARLPIPRDKGDVSLLAEYADKPVMLGIRPSDIHLDEEFLSEHPEWILECGIDLTELLGAEMNIYLKASGVDFTAVVPTKTAGEIGEKVKACFDMQTVHLFDPETENSILREKREDN